MHIAERVKKKTGTNWDRDQGACAVEAWPAYGKQHLLQSIVHVRPQVNLSRAKDVAASLALTLPNRYRGAV